MKPHRAAAASRLAAGPARHGQHGVVLFIALIVLVAMTLIMNGVAIWLRIRFRKRIKW